MLHTLTNNEVYIYHFTTSDNVYIYACACDSGDNYIFTHWDITSQSIHSNQFSYAYITGLLSAKPWMVCNALLGLYKRR